MEVRLSAEHQAWLDERIASGRFASAEQALDEAFVLLEAREFRAPWKRNPGEKSFAQLWMDSPFRGLNIEFPRANPPDSPEEL